MTNIQTKKIRISLGIKIEMEQENQTPFEQQYSKITKILKVDFVRVKYLHIPIKILIVDQVLHMHRLR